MFVEMFSLDPPGVYEVLLPPSLSVAVEDEVTVSTIEVTIGRGIHRDLLAILNSPDLKPSLQPSYTTNHHQTIFPMLCVLPINFFTYSYLHFALAIVHHAVLSCHGCVRVQGGGIEWHLFHFGDAADGVGLAGACRLVLVPPVTEELLKQSCLSSSRKNLDLQEEQSFQID